MGVIDIEGKQYLSNNEFFADAFNFLLYDGKEVIKPGELKELDTTELQDKVHYGMPVKNGLYDMLGYSKQIAEIKRSYRTDKKGQAGELTVEAGVLKIKLTSKEFLSGLRKDDRLMPIITAVVYLGEEPWDGPKSLYDMLDISDESLKKFIPNYWINLISPADMDEDDFTKFHTDLGLAMKVIKHQSDDADEIIMATNHKKIDRETATFLNKVANLKLEYEEKEGSIDMCKAMEKRDQRQKITGAIDVLRLDGASDEDIISKIMRLYNVTREYVLTLLTPQKV